MGAGKTTLLRILLGKLAPTEGKVRLGTNLQIAYFDQLREQLDDDKAALENVGDGYQTISFGDQTRHIIGYMQDFLFSPERARTLVRFLSGGERNRVLLARLFAKPANVIVLDEPTNDLDSETLELLEERLVDYSGTVLLVSHDRAFLNNVVTSTIVFDPDGDSTVKEYVGGYDDWIRQRSKQFTAALCEQEKTKQPASNSTVRRPKLSFKEQQELAALPAVIERLEVEIAQIHATMAQQIFIDRPAMFWLARSRVFKTLNCDCRMHFPAGNRSARRILEGQHRGNSSGHDESSNEDCKSRAISVACRRRLSIDGANSAVPICLFVCMSFRTGTIPNPFGKENVDAEISVCICHCSEYVDWQYCFSSAAVACFP